jgi:predicted enzyme related to lactoylglutathione lyase
VDGTAADGHPSWADLSTADIVAAKDFYCRLLGWMITINETPMGRYLIGSIGDREVAGMMAQSSEMGGNPSVWTSYFSVADIDATVAKVPSAGGSVLQVPSEIPNGARVAVVADPGGAMFALISGGPQPGPFLSQDVGAISWFELMTHNPQTVEAFYRSVFGWRAETKEADDGPYTVFNLSGTEIAGMIRPPTNPTRRLPSTWVVYFTVADCVATEALAVELGGQVILPSTDSPVGPFAVLADPQGATFQIMEFTEVSELSAERPAS